jgi:hypothetical protein
MSTSMLGWLRKRALVTAPEEITFPVRGFDIDDAPARPVLEAAALHFTVGFEFGIECRTLDGVYTRLETLQRGHHVSYGGGHNRTLIGESAVLPL